MTKMKIEDYAFLSDTQTAALVGRNGSVDWLCFPRFDSAACFAALIGETKNGRWLIAPSDNSATVARKYRGYTLILETTFETKDGAVRLIDFMPPRGMNPDIVRIVEGVDGKVSMRMELIIRFDYGDVVPWVRKCGDGLEAIAGPNGLVLRTPIETRGFRSRKGRACALRAHLVSVTRTPAEGDQSRSRAARHGKVLERLGWVLSLPR
jgi:GH15 family glucan-1,4-alpha-glucosidase